MRLLSAQQRPHRDPCSIAQESLLESLLESAYVASMIFVLFIDLPSSNAIDMQRLQGLVQESIIAPEQNFSRLERTYQNCREQ